MSFLNYVTGSIIFFYYYSHLSGFVTDEDVRRRESRLREDLKRETDFQVKVGASVEVAQVLLL